MTNTANLHSTVPSEAITIGKTVLEGAIELHRSLTVPAVNGTVVDNDISVVTPSMRHSIKEKTGRWSDEEHQIFLEGLEQHGKQWKIIAGMIGTRTVVQVRTHAQKYFQRMERHSTKPKRKMSLPTAMPSTKRTKSAVLQRSASIALGTAMSPPPDSLHHGYPSCVSNESSSVSTDGGWDTYSPAGVADLVDPLDDPLVSSKTDDAHIHDALEWLVDADASILPESSLPLFPDLSMGGADLEMPASMINEAALGTMGDPNVTVQSLLLLPDHEDNMQGEGYFARA